MSVQLLEVPHGLQPQGVQALPNPKMLALMAASKAPMAG